MTQSHFEILSPEWQHRHAFEQRTLGVFDHFLRSRKYLEYIYLRLMEKSCMFQSESDTHQDMLATWRCEQGAPPAPPTSMLPLKPGGRLNMQDFFHSKGGYNDA